jgi:ParB family chromosome partitioning protein
MSQKAIVETIDVPINQIKPSPYQPRLSFNLEDIRGSIQRDGILVPLTVRKKDGYYELVDGERRTRLAKELGHKTIPVTVINVDDDTARRMVWKVNTLRQEYSPREKAYYFKKLQEEYGMSLRGIARECDYSDTLVRAYLAVFRLPKEYQEYVWLGKIGVGHLVQLLNAGFFNGDAKAFVQAITFLDQIIEQKLSDREFQEVLEPTLREYQKHRVESAKKAVGEVVPEVGVPETPEELERAATTLRKEANKKREEALTPKEKAERKRMQEEKRHRAEEDRKRREEEEKQRIEEEAKRRARELEDAERRQIEEEARKKAQNEILSNPQLLQEVAQRAREERSEEFAEMEKRAREAAESIAQPLAEALIKAEEDSKVARSSKERKLLENYMFLGSIIQSLRDKRIFCTDHDHEEPVLMWSCGTPITKTHEELKAKLRLGK